MQLVDTSQPAKTLLTGRETIEIPGGQYLQIRHGDIESPKVELQEQVPVGKTWNVRLDVEIVET